MLLKFQYVFFFHKLDVDIGKERGFQVRGSTNKYLNCECSYTQKVGIRDSSNGRGDVLWLRVN